MINVSGPALSVASTATTNSLNAVVERLAAKDHTLWGIEAEAEALVRLNWIDLPTTSRALLPELDALTAWARTREISTIILAGMGGSSLAPEVIAKTYSKTLTVLDTTDPDQIKAAIPTDLLHTLIVVGSKSGSTIETASHKAFFTKLLLDAGLDPVNHFVIVTDPGSPLDKSARNDGLGGYVNGVDNVASTQGSWTWLRAQADPNKTTVRHVLLDLTAPIAGSGSVAQGVLDPVRPEFIACPLSPVEESSFQRNSRAPVRVNR